MKTLNEIIERLNLRKKELKKSLDDIVPKLRQMGAIKIILFGSFASEDITLTSDLDILVIMPDSKSGRDWLKKIYAEIERKIACDIFVFNTREYEDEKNKNFLLKEIAKKGQLIYEKKIQGRGNKMVYSGKG